MTVFAPGVEIAALEDMLESNIGRLYGGRGGANRYIWTDPPVVASERREMVNHPRHYNAHPSGVECIEICEHMTFNLGNAFKYGWRYNDKGDPVENLNKMLWYVARSFSSDTAHILGNREHAEFFRNDIMLPRRRVFDRPSPWCEPVRHAMAAICDLHCSVGVADRIKLYDKTERCLRTAIADEQCLGRAMQP